jgi:hypothetical protein
VACAVEQQPEHDRLVLRSDHPKRETTTTIKLWFSKYKQRLRTDEQHFRNAHKLIMNKRPQHFEIGSLSLLWQICDVNTGKQL